MSKYEVTHKCGHTVTHHLVGRIRDRDSRASWLEDQDCTDCWKKAQQAEAERVAEAKNLPALVGSEKQIAWASVIRADCVKIMDRLPSIGEILANGGTLREDGSRSDVAAGLREAVERRHAWIVARYAAILATADCRWWIDHRGDLTLGDEIVRLVEYELDRKVRAERRAALGIPVEGVPLQKPAAMPTREERVAAAAAQVLPTLDDEVPA